MDIDAQSTAYLRSGFYVFPCHTIITDSYGEVRCTCGKPGCTSQGKHPRTRTGVKEATNNPDIIQRWRTTFTDAGINWGLAQGSLSGTFVVDVDPKDGGDQTWDAYVAAHGMPDTLVATTGSGGKHLFFRYPTDRKIGNRVGWKPGVDIRSDGGYVIAAPGLHISGGTYAWDNWGTLPADAPGHLLDAIVGAGPTGIGAQPLPSDRDLPAGVPEGERDNTIFRAACRWRRQFGDDAAGRAQVLNLILNMAASSSPPFPPDEAKRKVDQAYAQDHSDKDLIVPFGGIPGGGSTQAPTQLPGTDDDPIFNLTDLGNALRFVRVQGDRFRYVTGMGWYQWGDLGWVKLEEDKDVRLGMHGVADVVRDEANRLEMRGANARLIQQYRSWATQSENNAKLSAAVTVAQDLPQLRRVAEEFDAIPHELACRNGIVDLRTGDLRQFSRDDLVTRNTGVLYDPAFRLPEWERYLDMATDGETEVMQYLQRAAGYTLTGLTAEECFFIISGPQRSGKSTFLDGLIAAMGTYQTAMDAEVFTRRGGREVDRADMVKFFGPRLITTSELPEGSRFDDSFLKRITGGDMMSGRMLYREAFNFRPRFKLWMATNHDPITQDSAMFERIKRVPFPRTVPVEKRDPHLKDIIKDPQIGGKAVLAWAVKGAIDYYKHGLTTPGQVTSSTADYQGDQNTFRQFLNECFDLDPEGEVPVSSAMATWKVWCDQNHERPSGGRPTFVKRIEEHASSSGVTVTRGRDWTVKGVRLRALSSVPFM